MSNHRSTLSAAAMICLLAVQALAITIPAGSPVTVRLIDSIDSQQTAIGEPFRASIDDPIVVGNRVVIPRGTPCTVQVMQVEQNKELAIRLYNVTLNGEQYDVASSYAMLHGQGKSKAKKARRRGLLGGGLGAGIGAIAGGGSGAAIGALVGGGLGAISGSAAKGKHLYVPSETRLQFQLRENLPVN